MPTKTKTVLTLTADDFGISRTANENILQLIHRNKLDRVEIMMSQNITERHVKALLASGVKLDIHLHLTKDSLDFWQNNPRSSDYGVLDRVFSFIFNYFFGKNRPSKVSQEWNTQIQDFKKLFKKSPDGISSHEHMHFFPTYFSVALKLAQKNKIPYIRFSRYWVKEKNPICLILNFLEKIDSLFFKKTTFSSADLLVSFDWIENFDEFLKKYPADKKIELVFHPEKIDEFEFLDTTLEEKLSAK